MQKSLEQLRQKIDAIDDQIFSLLESRSSFVKEVGELKSKEESNCCFLRPGREATMLRRVYAHFKNKSFDPQAAAAMWRVIIGAALNLESPLRISTFAPDANPELYWRAREYFGAFTPTSRQPNTQRVVADVVDGRAHIGILPLPQADNWWLHLAHHNDSMPKIFAHIPFVLPKMDAGNVGALAIAYVEPEETGDDVSLLALHTDHTISQSKLNDIATRVGLKASWVTAHAPSPDRKIYLVEVPGFVTNTSEPVGKFREEAGASLQNLIYMGSYATPIIV